MKHLWYNIFFTLKIGTQLLNELYIIKLMSEEYDCMLIILSLLLPRQHLVTGSNPDEISYNIFLRSYLVLSASKLVFCFGQGAFLTF